MILSTLLWYRSRLNHPIEVKKRRKTSVKGKSSESGTTEAAVVVKDYEFARNELAQAQDARSVILKFCHA